MADATIFALSSGAPPAAIAVLRVSGPDAGTALSTLAGALPQPRRASRRMLRDIAGAPLDDALVLWFPGPETATGEDVVELHLHGSRAVVTAVSRALSRLPGLRQAEPGEFTRRALENGRIDLSQAEGLADLLAAETEMQRRAALRTAEGGVGREVAAWSAQLADLAAMVEAVLDHEDEIDGGDRYDIHPGITELAEILRRHLDRVPVERLRDGYRIVLAGPPNAGKSSLINALTERDIAITSPRAGTTRDVIEATVIRDDLVYVLTDTAGLVAESDDPIEMVGVERAKARIEASDLVLWLGDNPPMTNALWLYPRADARSGHRSAQRLAVSIRQPASIARLWNVIEERLRHDLGRVEDQQLFNEWQRDCLRKAAAALEQASKDTDLLIVAEHLRLAQSAMWRMSGFDAVEDVLDALFRRFCLGK